MPDAERPERAGRMPILIFLRQYGWREYAVTLAVAAVAGLGIAVLINSAAGGGAGAPAVLKTKQELADASSRVLTTRVYKPVREARPARPGRPATARSTRPPRCGSGNSRSGSSRPA